MLGLKLIIVGRRGLSRHFSDNNRTSPRMKLADNYYNDVIMSATVYKITGVSMVCSAVCSRADLRKHQSSASLAFMRGNHRCPVDSPHKSPVTRKNFPFDDVIMVSQRFKLLPSCCWSVSWNAFWAHVTRGFFNVYWHIEAETKWSLF